MGVARNWFSRLSDQAPTDGVHYYHRAKLAQPNVIRQLHYYAKSLCVEIPYPLARESIMELCEPVMSPSPDETRVVPTSTVLNFLRTHGILFSGRQKEELARTMEALFQTLDPSIKSRSPFPWGELGYVTDHWVTVWYAGN